MYSGTKPERSARVKGRFKLSAGLLQVHKGNAVLHAISKKLVAARLSGE